ncbi:MULTISPECIES: hypothetical protein [unclassified Pseudoalteromonas]|uniref:hypothetical protein n=1 Tax=unclassified Pseudoalteromonas TaxID=194690 RepID=UPI003014B560
MSNNRLTHFLVALKSADVDKIKTAFSSGDIAAQVEALKFLFQSTQSNDKLYGHYQDIATVCLQAANFPDTMIGAINSLEKFAFFSAPLLQTEQVTRQNQQGNNILHTLLATLSAEDNGLNYLRTLLHFESKEQLQQALWQRNNKQLTPLECYLALNPNTDALAIQELSALLGLIEIERRGPHTLMNHNASVIESHLKQQQRLSSYKRFLLTTYYSAEASL